MERKAPTYSNSTPIQQNNNQLANQGSNPEDQLLFKLPTIQAKKHALKMFANEVRSLGSDPNSNLKALIIVLLKTMFGKQQKSEILSKLTKQINNVDNKLLSILNHPFVHQNETVLRATFIQQINVLMSIYKDNILKHAVQKNQLFIQTYLTRNAFLMEIFILLIRSQLSNIHFHNANNLKLKIQTQKSYEIITKLYGIDCKLMDQYYVFYDQQLLIASYDDKEYVYGRFYKDQFEMRRQSRLSASTLQFLNMLSANNKKRKQILIESKNESQNSSVLIDGQDLLNPLFNFDQYLLEKMKHKQMTKSQEKKQQIRINFGDKLDIQRNNDYIGQVITNIQMIESMHQEISVDGLDISKIDKTPPKKKAINQNNSIRNENRSSLKKKENDLIQRSREKKQNIFPFWNGPKLLQLTKKQSHNNKHQFYRNESFEFTNRAKFKYWLRQMDLSRENPSWIQNKNKSKRYCFCKQIAKKKNQLHSNIFSLNINLQLTPMNFKYNKTKEIDLKQKKQDKINSRQFQQIFGKKNFEYPYQKEHRHIQCTQPFASPVSVSDKVHLKTQPVSIFTPPFGQKLDQLNKIYSINNQQTNKIALSQELYRKKQSKYNRNLQAICSPKPFNVFTKSKGFDLTRSKKPTFKEAKMPKYSGVFDSQYANIPSYYHSGKVTPPEQKELIVNLSNKPKLYKHTSLLENYQDFNQR